MISQSQIKHLKSLQQKKFRNQFQQFVVEGEKMVDELLQSPLEIIHLFHTEEYGIQANKKILKSDIISENDLRKVSTLKTPNKVIAIATNSTLKKRVALPDDYSLVLDHIQDPGNLGTIIRTADWFGIKHIFCSPDTVDCYNPKVVQATMGSIFRVNIEYLELPTLFQLASDNNTPIIATSLKGDNLYKNKLPKYGLVVMGNESKGISDFTEQQLTHAVKIPSYPENSNVESLNVSIATALICAELRHPKSIN
jgi:TrmH family RNA methyltransferase